MTVKASMRHESNFTIAGICKRNLIRSDAGYTAKMPNVGIASFRYASIHEDCAALNVKEIHGYEPEIGLQLFTEKALENLQDK